MQRKLITTSAAVIASLALVSGPVFADESDTDVTENCPAAEETSTEDPIVAAAEEAAAAAEDLANGNACPELEKGHERAIEALTAARDRILAEGTGNGVAAQVLEALINGESPAGIGAAHGAAMAEAAGERRPEHAGPPQWADGPDAEGTESESTELDTSSAPDAPGRPEYAGPPGKAGRP